LTQGGSAMVSAERYGGSAANQVPPFCDINLFTTDACLQSAVKRGGANAEAEQLSEFGSDWGRAENFDLGRLANEFPPRLRVVDPRGNRLDLIEYHPAYHALMRKSVTAGLHASTWDGTSSQVARAARLFMAYQIESGHICPITMTHACVAVLIGEPVVLARWRDKIVNRNYDLRHIPWWEKSSVMIGMGMTERQGGTDVRSNETTAEEKQYYYELSGHKWFMSAPMCDAFLVLAQAKEGLTCFLLPRFRPDGQLNGLYFQRLKDKLGNRSNASSEVTFANAYAERIGPVGRGIRTIIEMVQLTRLDCAVASAGLMRMALAQAVHHARHRNVFQRRLSDQPLMRSLQSDLALESWAATALAFRLARAFDKAASDPLEAGYARLMTPAAKYLVCKIAPSFIAEAMECLGGNGYVEENPLARMYREAPVNAIWEGSGNVMALDVLRAASRAPDTTNAVLDQLTQTEAFAGTPVVETIRTQLLQNKDEPTARRITEQLARAGAAAALAEFAPDFAHAYAQSRFTDAHFLWGASKLGTLQDRLLDLTLP
jgi:putative acyl-CoA dehydrogenase